MKEKAIFLVGTFGSGKDVILRNVLERYNLPEFTLEQVRSALTTKISENDKKYSVLRKESMIISTSSTNFSGIRIIKETLELFGYDTSMIIVDANKSILLNRMQNRDNFDKSLFEEKIFKSKRNKSKLKKLFKYYVEYDNSSEQLNINGVNSVNFFVEEFLNNSFRNIIEENPVKLKKEYSLKKKLVGSVGDKLGISSKVSTDSISQDYSIRNSGAGFPSTVGPFYSESYASDPGVSLPAFSSFERQTPPTEFYSNEKQTSKMKTIKKVAREKHVNKT